MNIQISGQHLEITQTIKEHIHKKFSRLKKHFENMVDIHIVLKVEKSDHVAEATIHIRHQHIAATANSEDMYKTINLLVDKLDRQLVKYKEKITNHNTKH